MGYLNAEDLQEDAILAYKSEVLRLIEPCGSMTTFIDYTNDERENGDKIDFNVKVFMRQRWRVDVLPPDKFSKTFSTHRYIEAYYCTYGELVKEQDKIYTARDVLPHRDIDSNTLSDNYNY